MENTMTAQEIYETAFNLLGEFPEQDIENIKMALNLLNVLIADCFDVNNTLRIYNGKEKLKEIPVIDRMDESMEYEYVLCRDALPYGLAALIILEDDTNRAGFFDFRYQQKKMQYSKMENVKIDDTEEYVI